MTITLKELAESAHAECKSLSVGYVVDNHPQIVRELGFAATYTLTWSLSPITPDGDFIRLICSVTDNATENTATHAMPLVRTMAFADSSTFYAAAVAAMAEQYLTNY